MLWAMTWIVSFGTILISSSLLRTHLLSLRSVSLHLHEKILPHLLILSASIHGKKEHSNKNCAWAKPLKNPGCNNKSSSQQKLNKLEDDDLIKNPNLPIHLECRDWKTRRLIGGFITVLRTSPMVLSMWYYTLQLDENKVNICPFGSGNWFWLSTIAQFSVAGKKAQQSCAPA